MLHSAIPIGRAPRTRRPAAIRFEVLAGDQRLVTNVAPSPALADRWISSDRGIESEESSLQAIGVALSTSQGAAIVARSFGEAYDALLDLTQKEHARRSGYRQADILSKQQHVVVSCPAFDARLSWFWYDTLDRAKAEAIARCLLQDANASDSEIARTAAERIGSPSAAGGMRKVVGAARTLVTARRVLRGMASHLPEVTVDDVKRELGIDGRGDFLVMPLVMMCWRGEL